MSDDELAALASEYYTGTFKQFGETPRGVDWNSELAQQIRFDQILSVVRTSTPFTINDFGCGYGALFDNVRELKTLVSYVGYDVSATMVSAAKSRYDGDRRANFINRYDDLPMADYTLASGIFSVKGPASIEDWRRYLFNTINALRDRSRKGFAFNCLTAYSDLEHQRADLFYADPHELFEYCRKKYSRNLAILHDYGIYEFTIRVRLD